MDENKEKLLEEYHDYQKHIHDLITTTIRYFGYLDGIKVRFPAPIDISFFAANCAEDIIYQIQTAICLNIYKLLIDEGSDVYNLKNYKRKANNYLMKYLPIKDPKAPHPLKGILLDFRKNIIAHSIKTDRLSVSMSDLFILLKKSISYYNQITDAMPFGNESLFTDIGIENLIKYSKKGLMELLDKSL